MKRCWIAMMLTLLVLMTNLLCKAEAATFTDGQYLKLGYATGTPPVWNVKTIPGTGQNLFIGVPVATTSGKFGSTGAWVGSDVAQYLNGAYLISNFTADEILAGVLSLYGNNPLFNVPVSNTAATSTISPSSAGDSAIFILDVQEIQALYNGAANTVYDDASKYAARVNYASGGPFWTRSPVTGDMSKVWRVNADGSFTEEAVATAPIGVRPVVSADVSKMLFKTGLGTQAAPYEVYYRWNTTPNVTVSGDTVTLQFPEGITNFSGVWPGADAFTVLDDGGTAYTVGSVASGTDNNKITLKVTPSVASGKSVTVEYSQRFDDAVQGLNNTKGAILKASNVHFALPCIVLASSGTALTIISDATQHFVMGWAAPLDLAAEGGTQPYVWSVTKGDLPPGLSLSSAAGKVAGTPGTLGTYSVTIQVEDATGKTATKAFSFVVSEKADLMILTESLPNAQIGDYYTETLRGYGGTKPYVWSIQGLPEWLSLDSKTGIITGTPLSPAIHNFTVQLADSADATVTRELRLTVNEHDGLLIETRILDAAEYDKEYSVQLEASGGTPPYLFALRSGYDLPHGLSLSSTGLLSGKPSRRYSYDFVIDVMDGNKLKGSAVYTMVIVDGAILNPSGSDFKAKEYRDDKKIRIDFYLPKGYNDTEVLSVESLTSPASYITSSSSSVARQSNGGYKVELMMYVSEAVLNKDGMNWDALMKALYFDGFVVKFQNCSGETTRFTKGLLVKDLKGKSDDGGGCNGVGLGMGGLFLLVWRSLTKKS